MKVTLEENMQQIADRIRSLREDLGYSMKEMAEATGRTLQDYAGKESGEEDLSFTFLYKCASVFGVDVIELITGEAPHLSGYAVCRQGEGLPVTKKSGFEYLHKAPNFRNKLAEPFLVTEPYLEEEQGKPIHLSHHKGQELDFIISGKMRFAFEDHEEILEPGDFVMYDSGRHHGMIAIDGEPVTFLAVVIRPQDGKITEA